MSESTKALEYARKNREPNLAEFKELLTIPSISTLSQHKPDMQRTAEWLAKQLSGINFKNVAVLPTAGHPVVYGEWLGAEADKPTVLVYGHYDVVPADVEDGWVTLPFEPTLKDGKIYARGATDDKGQLAI